MTATNTSITSRAGANRVAMPRPMTGTESPTYRIGIMHSLSLIDLAGLLTTFHRNWPEVQLLPSAAMGGSVELADDVAEGRLDLAFAALPAGYPSGLAVRTLAAEQMLLACPPGEPLGEQDSVQLHELDGKRFVELPAGWGTRIATDLVAAGFGFAFMTPSMVTGRKKQVLRPVHPAPEFVVSLITPRDQPFSEATQAMVDLVGERYPELHGH